MSDSCPPTAPGAYPSDCELLAAYRDRSRLQGEQSRCNDPHYQRVLARAQPIRLLLLDVDGVLTDGSLIYSNAGEESKAFHTQDGFGLRLLREAGIDTGIITARQSALVARRASELQMRFIHQGMRHKQQALQQILAESGYKPYQLAYMGDDWLDLPLLQQVGLALAPANCVAEVAAVVHYVTPRSGGQGAVRDACQLLLEASGKLPQLLQQYQQRC